MGPEPGSRRAAPSKPSIRDVETPGARSGSHGRAQLLVRDRDLRERIAAERTVGGDEEPRRRLLAFLVSVRAPEEVLPERERFAGLPLRARGERVLDARLPLRLVRHLIVARRARPEAALGDGD